MDKDYESNKRVNEITEANWQLQQSMHFVVDIPAAAVITRTHKKARYLPCRCDNSICRAAQLGLV